MEKDSYKNHTKFNETDFKRDTDYWNSYYSKIAAINLPSLFAKFIYKNYLKAGKDLLEIGCGNGRDSLYFASKGINVTAIDASDFVIDELNLSNKSDNARFICGDFVESEIIYSQKYDYCYSRFSLHAVSAAQEDKLLDNIKSSLRSHGKFFVEVRSIHDDLYGKGVEVGKNCFVNNGHFRRFIDKDELESILTLKGYTVEYSEESRDFAPFNNENPPVIRIIASV